MRDAGRVSRALLPATGAVKLNYEIHGNSPSHLHMHFFPRISSLAAAETALKGQAIDSRLVVQPVYAKGDFKTLRNTFLRGLSYSLPGVAHRLNARRIPE